MMFFFNSYAEFYTEQHILYSSCVSLAIIPVTRHNKLGPYLAGIIEGDGTIIIPKTNKTLKGTNNYGYIQIYFALKDLPLARYFQQNLGGYITIKPTFCTLTFKSKDSVFKVITLINGKMRTPKVEALHRLINWFNLKYNTNIIALPLDNTNLQDNNWLAGFLDADGGFYFHWKISDKTGMPIRLTHNIRISQRSVYHRASFVGTSYFFIMNEISKFMNVNLGKIDRQKQGYRELAYVTISYNYISNYIILSYLLKYPLYTYKYINLPVQIQLLRLSINKLHKSNTGITLLEHLKNMLDCYSEADHINYINLHGPAL